MALKVNIVDGPDKFLLSVGLFDYKELVFSLADNTKTVLIINQVRREDGSGNSWIIKGNLKKMVIDNSHFEGYYNTQKREGYLKIS